MTQQARLTLLSPGLFRLILACIVFAQHSTRLFLGGGAVFVFYALSGYWISDMWDAKYSVTRNPTRVFYVSRLWRILPAFWVANIVTLWEQIHRHGVPAAFFARSWEGLHVWFANLLLLGYSSLPHVQQILGTAWSLDVEMQFYVLFPLMVLMPKRWRSKVLLFLGLFGVWTICRYGEPVSRHIVHYLFFFALGLFFEARRFVIPKRVAIGFLIVAAIIFLLAVSQPAYRGLYISSAHALASSSRWTYAANCGLALLVMPLAFYTVSVPSNSTDRMLGDLSYLVYLFHLPALHLLGPGYLTASLRTRLPQFLVVWVTVFLFSYLFWKFLHLPIERRRRNFIKSQLLPTPANALAGSKLNS